MSDPTPIPNVEVTARGRWGWLKRMLPTNWRAFVIWAMTLLCVYAGNCIRARQGEAPEPLPAPPMPIFPDAPFGWRPPSEVERQETLALLTTPRWSDTEAGQDKPDEQGAPLWRMYAKATGQPFPAHDQGSVGACVAFGAAAAAEFSLAARVHFRRAPLQEFAVNVREAVYAGSRINADPRHPIRGGDGSTGARASRWLQRGVGGLLPRGRHGARELGAYDPQRCRAWGDRGVPDDLVAVCREQPCQTTLVTGAADARRALQQGYALFVCSDVGFGVVGGDAIIRDAEGFLKPRGIWYHCMCIAGYRGGARPGFLLVNSWGENWIGGPKGTFADIPAGSFWADFAAVDHMLRQGDSYAVADVEGFRKRRIDPSDWIVAPSPRGRGDHALPMP